MPAPVPLFSPPDRIRRSASVFNFDEKATIYQAGEQLFAEGDPVQVDPWCRDLF
jgi:hypothetical protein